MKEEVAKPKSPCEDLSLIAAHKARKREEKMAKNAKKKKRRSRQPKRARS